MRTRNTYKFKSSAKYIISFCWETAIPVKDDKNMNEQWYMEWNHHRAYTMLSLSHSVCDGGDTSKFSSLNIQYVNKPHHVNQR